MVRGPEVVIIKRQKQIMFVESTHHRRHAERPSADRSEVWDTRLRTSELQELGMAAGQRPVRGAGAGSSPRPEALGSEFQRCVRPAHTEDKSVGFGPRQSGSVSRTASNSREREGAHQEDRILAHAAPPPATAEAARVNRKRTQDGTSGLSKAQL